MRLGARLLAGILSGISLAPVLTSLPRSAPAIRTVESFTSQDGVVPGGALELAVRVTLRSGFHLNSHTPSQTFLIPTTLETEPLPGVTFGEWGYPKGEARRFSFAEDPIQVYEGTIVIRGSVKIAGNAMPGRRRAVTRLRFQACTTDRCYPPGREEVVLDFRVVPPGQATRPQHPDLFQDVHP